jgi:CubicO group peptidase (beta-lactamase class C family)
MIQVVKGGQSMVTKMGRRAFFGGSAVTASILAGGSAAFSIGNGAGRLAGKGRDYFPPPDSEGGWRTLDGAEEIRKVAGIDVGRLDEAFGYTQTTSKYGGLLVARRGWLVYEKYFGRATREVTPNLWSVGKAFTSVSCGIMLHEERDKIPDALETMVFSEKYLPEAFPLSDPRKAGIKLGHLLAMTSGMAEAGTDLGIVRGQNVKLDPTPPLDFSRGQDEAALNVRMWTDPGGGYFYSSQGAHVASIVLRHLSGMELQAYIGEKLAVPMGFGGWGYETVWPALGVTNLPHTFGGGGIALRATDALRFAYLMLRQGRWGNRQLVPAEYIGLCGKPSPYNVHSPFSLQFEANRDGHVFGAPRDAFFKSGAGGFCVYAVPSLDLAVYKIAFSGLGGSRPYDLGFSGPAKVAETQDPRDDWAPHPGNQFVDGPVDGDAGTRRALELVVSSVVDD